MSHAGHHPCRPFERCTGVPTPRPPAPSPASTRRLCGSRSPTFPSAVFDPGWPPDARADSPRTRTRAARGTPDRQKIRCPLRLHHRDFFLPAVLRQMKKQCPLGQQAARFGQVDSSAGSRISLDVRFLASTQNIDTDENNLTFTVTAARLASFAELEQELSGICKAKINGKSMGRPGRPGQGFVPAGCPRCIALHPYIYPQDSKGRPVPRWSSSKRCSSRSTCNHARDTVSQPVPSGGQYPEASTPEWDNG
jgi:hypothetical protein